MAAILSVRIKSDLSAGEVAQRIHERLPSFREVPGLLQKIFGRDPETGDICGIYFFDDEASLERYRASELAQSIPAAYEALEVRREVYGAVCSVYPEHGPLAE